MSLENIKIIPFGKNAKKHPFKQLEAIANSIKRFGFRQPIIISSDGIIIVGHGRYFAAKDILGWTEIKEAPQAKKGEKFIPVLFGDDLSGDEISAYRLADNKLNESDWELELAFEQLSELNKELFDLTGFDRDEFDGMLNNDIINELVKNREIDLGKYNVLTVEAPEAPRLKARMSFYCDDIKDFEKVKEYFKLQGGQLDTVKLLDMLK